MKIYVDGELIKSGKLPWITVSCNGSCHARSTGDIKKNMETISCCIEGHEHIQVMRGYECADINKTEC